jgi:hypothetical protein
MDWVAEIRAASAGIDAWISGMAPGEWFVPRPGGWTDKDMLGHLVAWSELLTDEVEALKGERPEAIEIIDVHAWNAEQVAKRSGLTVEQTIAAWRRAVQRVTETLAGLAPETRSRRWRLAWAAQPVCIDDLVGLWFVHLDQHRSRLGRSPD